MHVARWPINSARRCGQSTEIFRQQSGCAPCTLEYSTAGWLGHRRAPEMSSPEKKRKKQLCRRRNARKRRKKAKTNATKTIKLKLPTTEKYSGSRWEMCAQAERFPTPQHTSLHRNKHKKQANQKRKIARETRRAAYYYCIAGRSRGDKS